jgi:hypothetical protein
MELYNTMNSNDKSSKVSTKVQLGSWSESVAELISAQGLNSLQVRNAVDSALGELTADDIGKIKSKSKIKVGDSENPDLFQLTEKQTNKFSGPASSPLRLYYFNQELLAMEKTVGVVSLNGWPSYLGDWMKKFAPLPEQKAA